MRGFRFSESVYRAADAEGGSDVENDTDVADVASDNAADTDAGDSPDAEAVEAKPLTVREELKKAIAESSEPDKAKRDPKTGRFNERPTKAKERDPASAEPATSEAAPATAPAAEMPASLSKDLKPVWDATPPEMQAAFLKRETDIAKGVEELKQRYTQIDQAIAPHTDALRQMNATPGDAVNRMFLWFKALAGQPAQAFPELAKSMGIDWQKLTASGQPDGGTVLKAGEGAPPAEGSAPEIPEPVRQYVGNLQNELAELKNYVQQIGGRFGSVEQNLNSQNEARTRENLSIWSQGKPHFEEVRGDMAKLIETGVIPLKADGQVDLDTAYERAIYFNPEVRAKVLAEQQQANQQAQLKSKEAATTAQQTQVDRARKAAVSLPVSTPGEVKGIDPKKKPGDRLSVRESLKAAMAELRDQ